MNFDLENWMLVFVRASAMLTIFPVFSAPNFPVQMRIALGALIAYLVAPALPEALVSTQTLWGLVGAILMEAAVGLVLGYTSRMLFYALDLAGQFIATEMGLSLPPSMNPFSQTQTMAPGAILNYLAAMIWLSLDMHHWLLIGFQRTYHFLPAGGAQWREIILLDMVGRTGQIFFVALQMATPIMAVSFIISLVFAVLGRAVPQMNVFTESFAVRTLAGLAVFGMTFQLMAQHITNYLRRLPEDVLRVAQMLGTG